MEKELNQGHLSCLCPIILKKLTRINFVDNLIEDEAEREILLSKPTCFLIVGAPGVGKSTLAKKLAESWECILVDDTDLLKTHIKNQTKQGLELIEILSEGKSIPEDMVLQLILARLNSPDVEHYGYVLSCLPFMSEECLKVHEQIELIKTLKLTPDFIINIKCADKDLARRLSDLKQHPETGKLYTREQLKCAESNKDVFKKDNVDEEAEVEEELATEEELPKDAIYQMVWTPENLVRNVLLRISMYKDTVLGPLENYIADHNPIFLLEVDGNNTPEELNLSVISRLESMAIKPVSIPTLIQHSGDEELPEDIETEDLLRIMCSSKMMVPGFRWKRSRWGRTCPVALKEGNVIPGKPGFCVGFQGKLYILSSNEAYLKFITNPRRYLLPPMPSPPCRVAIIGPPKAGTTTQCKLLAEHYNALVLDMEELVKLFLTKVEQERLEKIKVETTQVAIDKVRKEQHGGQTLDETTGVEVTEDHPEVKAMVLSALEEAKQLSTSPPGNVHAEALENYIKEIEEANADKEVGTAWILDNFPRNFSQMESLKQVDILPDIVFCLTDSDGNEVLKRFYKMNKESLDKAGKNTSQEENSENDNQVSNQKLQASKLHSNQDSVVEDNSENCHLGIIEKEDETYLLHDFLGYPEMNDYKLQVRQFMSEWEEMQSALNITYSELEIGNKSPEDLLREMVLEMEKPFQYVSWELSSVDQDEEVDDYDAIAELEKTEEESSDNDAPEEETEGDRTSKRLLGEVRHFCPVSLKKHNVLWPCTDEIAARYREKTYFLSSIEARDAFLQNPAHFVSQTEPLKPPALRIFLLGPRGSGKTTHGDWLAQQLGLFHVQFREQLQMIIMAKTKKRVPHHDEVEPLEEARSDLDVLIKEALGETEKSEDSSNNMDDMEQKFELTAEEMAIKAYLSDGEPLTPEILDMLITPYWKEEPYMSTGFILEGFPHHPDEVQYMLQQQLFPDVVVIITVDVADVQKRLLQTYLENWREHHNCHVAQLNLLHNLRVKNREAKICRRRAELVAERGSITAQTKDEEDDEQDGDNEDAENAESEIESILEQEFPLEENNEDIGSMETEATATNRLTMDIEERFVTDENNLVALVDLLSIHNIPKMSINGSRKMRIVRYQLLRQIQPLLSNRESLFQTSQPISYRLANMLLFSSLKFYSAFGCWDPIKQYEEGGLIQPLQWPLNSTHPLIFHQYIYFFASKDNRHTFMLNPLKYLRQSKPTPPLPIKIAITGPPKSGKSTVAQMFTRKYGLMRLSIGSAMRMLAIQCLEVALMSSACSNHGYVLDGFPVTHKQAQLMDSRSIIPMIVVELELDTVEVLKRGLVDKMNPNKPHLLHDSSENLYIRTSCYKQEVEPVRKHFQKQYQNWILLDGLKSKLWIWSNIRKEVSISMKYIHSYLERTRSGNAACINRLCITPKELQVRLGEFQQYCPVCLALHNHLMDCTDVAGLTYMAEYKKRYYKMCSEEHLEKFLITPHEFVTPGCPHTLPQPHLLPRKLTETQVKNRFPQQAEMKGFCPVSYLDGKQRYEALVRGNIEYAVEYRERIYIFETKQKQDKFLRSPETYWNQKLPSKVPPLCEPLSLTSLPTLGYLEQGMALAVIKAMTAVGCLKPKYPFLNIEKSAHYYVALYLKAFNPKSIDYNRQMYKKKLALFEENCALIPYLSSTMGGNYKSPSERPIDFEFKLKRFPGDDLARVRRVPGDRLYAAFGGRSSRMSKRKSNSLNENPNKRSRVVPDGDVSDASVDGGPEDPLLNEQFAGDSVSDAGIVERITLKNFMCHSLLGPFDFGPNVNFVVGNNGSGKSAILTALIVALGGNAQATNRGSSLKGFVKEGESSADVSITLRNKGRDAYKPEVFGSVITVDLRITREGLRTYKLKSQSGHVVSSKKEELMSILDNFNIQVNNPVSILTQEMSKYFLHSKGEGDKYKFFMKATQLEQMREDYVYIKSTKHVTEDKVGQHGECLKDLKRKYLEKEDRYKSLASLDEMQTKLEELRKQMAWALVAEMERELEPMKEKLQLDKKSTEKYDEKVKEWQNKIEEAERNCKQIQEQLERLTQQVQELQPKCAELKAEAQRQNTLLKSSEVTVHRCRASLRDLEKDKVQLSSRINDLKLSISQTTGAESQARTARIEQIQAEVEDLKHQISTLGQQIDQYQIASNRAKDEQGKMRREQEVLQRSIEAKKRNLRTLENSRSNRLQRFGEHMPALLNSIQQTYQKGQFKHKPRGPLGYLISLKDPEMALAVEVCLKGQLLAFTCDNHEDEKVLQGLMARVFPGGRRPAIITSQFLPRVHDTRKRAVNHPEYPSVLQALEIEDSVVANCLIDQRGIESILLIKNRTEARRVMQGKNPPQNCTQAFSKDGDQIFNNRNYAAEQSRANYLSGDVEEEIRHLQMEIENQTAQANRFKQQMKKLDDDIKQNEGLLRKAHVAQRTANDKVTKLQLELSDLNNVEEPQSEDLRPLEEELQDNDSKILFKRTEYEGAQTQMAKLKASYEKADQEYKQHKEKISTIAEEADSIKEELSKADQEVTRCNHHKKHYDSKRSAHVKNIETLEANLKNKEKELEASMSMAREICPERVEVRRTAKSLDSEINRLRVKINTQQEQQGDREEVVRQYHEALGNYKNMAQQMKNLNSFIKCLDSVLNQRLQAYADFRRFLSARCKYYFDSMLAQRGYTGSMTFDHKNETLSISVQPGKGSDADSSDMRSLSGGERSFSTVCFVLSLWAITEAPFRCLDEFDVYMDMVNRRISMDMMLKVAAAQRYRQFIFLTPQSMGSLPVSRLMHIHRLKDPDRGQNNSDVNTRTGGGAESSV
ncbi:hypothetical protein Q5P01_004956 [Channa striata]|uniref:Structural maintenance of chromosomes protein 6 n=1 Tax=Channa striata TaxID=64152 RepID=A0AA88NF75_CHASR|nr:hypothetical protein Q5P01_004956 [Channa striata]